MSDDTPAGEPAVENELAGRAWRPSGRPDYRRDRDPATSSRIVERNRSRGWLRSLSDLLKQPAVKVVLVVSLFVLAAIVYDATINNGSWTQRATKPKPVQKATRAPGG